VLEQLLEIDPGETRHHAGRGHSRQTDHEALLRVIGSHGGRLGGLELNHCNSDEQHEEGHPLEAAEALV